MVRLSAKEFSKNADRYAGQRVIVIGKVTHAIRELGGTGAYILDGAHRETSSIVSIVGTVVGGQYVTALCPIS